MIGPVFSYELVHTFEENGSAPTTLSGYGILSRFKPKKNLNVHLLCKECIVHRKHQLYATIHDLTPQYTYISRSPINLKEDGNYDEWRVVEVVVYCATNKKIV